MVKEPEEESAKKGMDPLKAYCLVLENVVAEAFLLVEDAVEEGPTEVAVQPLRLEDLDDEAVMLTTQRDEPVACRGFNLH